MILTKMFLVFIYKTYVSDGGTRTSELNQALLFMVCKDHLPLQTSENEGFCHFAKVAVPLWTPPSRQTLTRLCEAKYSSLKDIVCGMISHLPAVSLTFDLWTETHTVTSYLGGTLHFLNGCTMETCFSTSQSLTNRIQQII